jgi:hypothetical protein
MKNMTTKAAGIERIHTQLQNKCAI